MQEAGVLDLAAWETFYVIVGSAAAVMMGLMFVAITLIADVHVSPPVGAFATFHTPTVFHFGAALLVAALLTAPWPALWMAGLPVGLCGLAGVAFALILVRRVRRQTNYQAVLEDWL